MAGRQDLFNECYSGEQTKLLSPEQFKDQFCRRCRNPGCNLSGLGRSRWQYRVDHQVENLLENPSFADPNDPRFADLASMPFDNAFREVVKMEISADKGDWEPVSDEDVSTAVGELVKAPQPEHFEEAPDDEPEPEVLWEGVITGSKGDEYEVALAVIDGNEAWTCSCPAFRFRTAPPEGCQHIQVAQEDLRAAKAQEDPSTPEPTPVPPSETTPETAQQPDVAPEPEQGQWQSMKVSGALPRARNTKFPQDGMMVDGTPAPEPETTTPEPDVDPWAPPPEKPKNVVPVGGKVVLGGGPKKEDG